RRDGALAQTRPADIQRLWPANAIGAAALERLRKIAKILGVSPVAMPVDNHHQLATGMADADVPPGAGEFARVAIEPQIRMPRLQRTDHRAGAVGRFAVHDDD